MRRKPQQARAKAMVQAVVDAGFRSIQKHGIEATTTRHIADLARISPGTLYQYFADKEAVFQAMSNRFVDDLIDWLQTMTPDLVQKDIGELVESLLYGFRDWLGQNDGRYLEYARHLQRFNRVEHMARLERTLLALSAQYALRHPQIIRLNIQGIPAMLYIMINGGASTVIAYLSSPSPYFSFEQLVGGLANMVRSYVAAELNA